MIRRRIREDNLTRCPACGAWAYRLRCRRCEAVTPPLAVDRPPCPRPGCLGGWLHAPGADDAPTPCPTCKPHLRPVRDQPRETA